MNTIDLLVLLGVIFLVLLVIFFRFIFPKIKTRIAMKRHEEHERNECNCR